jgi:hypothetical protein
MNSKMDHIPKLRRQRKQFQEQLLLQVQSLKHAKCVFKMNAKVRNKRVVTAMRKRILLLVFKGELVTLQIHLLKKAIKVNVQELLLQVQSLKHAKCVQDECKCVKQDSCESHEDKNIVVGLQRRVGNSSNSPPQKGDKGECSRYISAYNSISFDYVKHGKLACKNGRKFPCIYCGLYNHHVSRCWKRLTTFMKLSKQRKLEKTMQKICTHCQKRGHLIDQCSTLHPTTHSQHKKQMDEEIGKDGRGDSIINVSQDDSQEDDFQQKKFTIELAW